MLSWLPLKIKIQTNYHVSSTKLSFIFSGEISAKKCLGSFEVHESVKNVTNTERETNGFLFFFFFFPVEPTSIFLMKAILLEPRKIF